MNQKGVMHVDKEKMKKKGEAELGRRGGGGGQHKRKKEKTEESKKAVNGQHNTEKRKGR